MEGVLAPGAWYMSRFCQEFGCLPSQLENEDALQLLEIVELRNYAQAKALVEQKDTTEDDLTRAGVPAAMIDRVMANIDRAGRDKRKQHT